MLPNPWPGNQPNRTEKTRIRSIARKKFGVETPPSETIMISPSSGVCA